VQLSWSRDTYPRHRDIFCDSTKGVEQKMRDSENVLPSISYICNQFRVAQAQYLYLIRNSIPVFIPTNYQYPKPSHNSPSLTTLQPIKTAAMRFDYHVNYACGHACPSVNGKARPPRRTINSGTNNLFTRWVKVHRNDFSSDNVCPDCLSNLRTLAAGVPGNVPFLAWVRSQALKREREATGRFLLWWAILGEENRRSRRLRELWKEQIRGARD